MSMPAGAMRALSLNRYLFGYTGNVAKLRANDGLLTEADFILDNTNVLVLASDGVTTVTSWLSGLGGSAAFIETWYDQDGSNNATQGTNANQPEIRVNGTPPFQNYIYNDGTGDRYLSIGTGGAGSSLDVDGYTHAGVMKADSVATKMLLFSTDTTRRIYFGLDATPNWLGNINANDYVGGTPDTNDHYFSQQGEPGNHVLRIDGVQVASHTSTATGTAASSQRLIGGVASIQDWNGRLFEYVSYNSFLSGADLTQLESDIADFYFPTPGGSDTVILRRRIEGY